MKLLNPCTYQLLILIALVLAPVSLNTPVAAQTSAESDVPFAIRNAFYNKYGKPWAAGTPEQRNRFLQNYQTAPRSSAVQLGQTPSAPTAQRSETLKAPFSIRNAYFRRNHVAWEDATEKQRKQFIKKIKDEQKAAAQQEKAYKKEQKARDKANRQRVKEEQRKHNQFQKSQKK